MLEGLLNETNSSRFGAHVFDPRKPRGKGVYIQSNLRSKDFEDIASCKNLSYKVGLTQLDSSVSDFVEHSSNPSVPKICHANL